MHEAHAELAELPRRERQAHRLAVDQQLAVVGIVEARQDLDQRRLARAVLPEQAVHLAGENAQVDARRACVAAEALGQVCGSSSRGAAASGSLGSTGPRASGSRHVRVAEAGGELGACLGDVRLVEDPDRHARVLHRLEAAHDPHRLVDDGVGDPLEVLADVRADDVALLTSFRISGVPLNVETLTCRSRPGARIAAATKGTSALS